MTTAFPTDKTQPFVADNGVTYFWEDNRWRVKAYKMESSDYVKNPYTVYVGDDAPTESVSPDKAFKDGELYYSTLTLELFAYGGGKWWPTAADFTGDITVINAALTQAEKDINTNEADIDQLEAKVAELEVTKGSVARYKVKATAFEVASRNGEIVVNDTDAAAVTIVSLAPFDLNGNPTKACEEGDILELDTDSGAVRYTIDSGTIGGLTVVYNNGAHTFAVDEELDLYAYPQNKKGVSQDYVDAQDALRVLKTGDSYSGYLDFEAYKGGARFFRGADKYFSIWSYTTDEIRCRVDQGRNFKLTGYREGSDTEHRLINWHAADGLHINKLVDPTQPDEPVTLKYADANYLRLDGGKTTGKIGIGKSSSGTDGDGFFIEGTLKDGTEGDILHVFHNAGVTADAVNYNGRVNNDSNIQTKASVKDLISEAMTGGGSSIPVGTVMMWLTNTPPTGWFLCKGGTYDASKNPDLDKVLQGMHGYKKGKLPDMKGLYPGGAGSGPSNLTPDQPGHVHAQRTAQPSGGPPKTSYTIPDGTSRKANSAGGTNYYSNGVSKVSIDSGWDSVTRPPTFAVNFMIRGDY